MLAFYYHSKIFSKLLIYGGIIGTTIGLIVFSYKNDYGVLYFFKSDTDMFDDFYNKPWFRAPPYFLGLLFGMYYREY